MSEGRYDDTAVRPLRSETVICVRVESPEIRAEATSFASIAPTSALYVSVFVDDFDCLSAIPATLSKGPGAANAPCAPRLRAATRVRTKVNVGFTGADDGGGPGPSIGSTENALDADRVEDGNRGAPDRRSLLTVTSWTT